jgi:adenine-specific DNA methylase
MRRAEGRKRLSIWSALPPYLGGKRRLCPLVFRELDRILPRRMWPNLTFVDGFMGGGSVSLYAKAQGLRIVATDIAERAIVVGRALIENNRVRLAREDILRVAAGNGDPPGRVEQSYVPSVFTRSQARLLDHILSTAGEARDDPPINNRRVREYHPELRA